MASSLHVLPSIMVTHEQRSLFLPPRCCAAYWSSSNNSLPCLASTCKATPPIMAKQDTRRSAPARIVLPAQPGVTITPKSASSVQTSASRNSATEEEEDDDDDDSWCSSEDMDLLKLLSEERRLGENGHHQAKDVRILPKGCKPVALVGEGAANVVFEFTLPDGGSLYQGKTRLLLRVAKTAFGRQSPKFNYLAQQRFYHTRIQPLLGPLACYQELVKIRGSGISDAINDYLRRVDSQRRPKFRGTFIQQSDWGFLLEDMQPTDSKKTVLVEFKPKWLSQSPGAPVNAIRCRQCARELQNFVLDPSTTRRTPETKHCPLTLGHKRRRSDTSVDPFRITHGLTDEGNSQHMNEVLTNLMQHESLRRLRSLQEKYDKDGPLQSDESNLDLSLAMTLRDCTMFAHIDRHHSDAASAQPKHIRFCDWDMKDPTYKLEHWQEVEEGLINGGFYTAEWIRCGQTYYQPPTNCHLETKSHKSSKEPEIICAGDVNEIKTQNGREGQNGATPREHHVKTDVSILGESLKKYKKAPPGDQS